MVGKDALEVSLLADLSGVDQAEPVGAALHEEREDVRVFKLVRDHVRRLGPSETKDVNAPTGLRIMLGEVAFTDGGANRLRIVPIRLSPFQILPRASHVLCGAAQKAEIHRLVGKLPQAETARYAIDWLENVPRGFLWPDNIEKTFSDTVTVTLGGVTPTRPKLVMTGNSAPRGGSWAAAQLEVDGIHLYLCEAQGINSTEAKKPGYIVYDGVPTDDFRDRIRRCLSFSLGSYL